MKVAKQSTKKRIVNKILNRAGKTLGFLNVKELKYHLPVFHVQKEYEALLGDGARKKLRNSKRWASGLDFHIISKILSRKEYPDSGDVW